MRGLCMISFTPSGNCLRLVRASFGLDFDTFLGGPYVYGRYNALLEEARLAGHIALQLPRGTASHTRDS